MTGKIRHQAVNGHRILKAEGDVRVSQSPALSQYLESLKSDEHLQSFVIDLSEADSLDSTALGLIAKIAIYTEAKFGFKPIVFDASEDVSRIIRSMGFEKILVMETRGGVEAERLEEIECDEVPDCDLRQAVLDAHRTLMSLCPENWDSFSDLVEALESELGSTASR